MDIIFISRGRLDAPFWHNTQQVGVRLSDRNRVLFVERPLSVFGLVKVPSYIWNLIRGIRRKGPNLFVILPPKLLPSKTNLGLIGRINMFPVLALVRMAKRKIGLSNPILWVYDPEYVRLLGKLGERLSVYSCVDEISSFPQYRKKKKEIVEEEIRLIEKVDIVFCTSNTLAERKKRFNPNTYYVPNAVNFEVFSKATSEYIKTPDDIRKIPHPIIGFIGVINEYKVDVDLIRYISTSYPEWSVVLIGPIEYSLNLRKGSLPRAKNIYYLGRKPQHELPAYLKAFDVCIIPDRLNENTECSFPLKLFEYLAAGKPVVTTNIPTVQEYREIIKIATSRQEFVKHIAQALSEDNRKLRMERINVAKENTWEDRVRKMEEIIRHYLRKKYG